MLVPSFIGCNSLSDPPVEDLEMDSSDNLEDDSGDENETVNSELVPLTKDGAPLYGIVYDPSGVEGANRLASQVVSTLTEKTEHKVDFRRYSSNNLAKAENLNFIFVGAVNGYTDTTFNSLRIKDYCVEMSDANIVFGGYSYEKLYLAMGRFTEALIYMNGELYVDISKQDLRGSGDYSLSDIKVADVSISEYSIVYGNSSTLSYAQKLSNIIADAVGYILPVVEDTVAESDYEIIVGVTNRNPNDTVEASGYAVSIDGKKVKFIANNDVSAEMMAAHLCARIRSTKSNQVLDLTTVATNINGSETTRMMTFNVHNAWGNNATEEGVKISTMILANNLDIVCLQEYDNSFRKSAGNLQTLLASRFVEVEINGVDSGNVWNPIFYNKDKYEVIESGFTDMYAEGIGCYENLKYPDGDGRTHFRTLVWAVLKDKASGQLFVIGNLHYSASNGDHKAESTLLISKLASVRSKYSEAIVLVAGDYNSTVSKDACKYMIDAGYVNTLNMASLKGTDNEGNIVGNGIDNILTVSEKNAKISIESAVALQEGGIENFSDHLPIVIQFKVN